MKYNKAISKAVEMFKSKEKKSRVLDIGTGTGILAMMAAKINAFSVTACEVVCFFLINTFCNDGFFISQIRTDY